jgi:hypothetical protein
MNFTMYIPCLQIYYTIISCVYFFNSNFLIWKSINAENNLKIGNDSEKFRDLHMTQPMWCSAYTKSFEIKLKYESRMHSNSCSFTRNILKLLLGDCPVSIHHTWELARNLPKLFLCPLCMITWQMYKFQDLRNKITFIIISEKYWRMFVVVSRNHSIRKSFPFRMCVLR